MDNIISLVEFTVIVSIGILYNLSQFREKILEFQIVVDEKIAPLQRRQNEIEGELRRIDAVVKSEDIIDSKSDSFFIFVVVMLLLKKDENI